MTKEKIAKASVKAIPKIMVARIDPSASGFLPKASTALPATIPIPIPGPITPSPIDSAVANNFAASGDIIDSPPHVRQLTEKLLMSFLYCQTKKHC